MTIILMNILIIYMFVPFEKVVSVELRKVGEKKKEKILNNKLNNIN